MHRIAWTNDLHFDRMKDHDRDEFVQWVRDSGVDALVIAGDIGEADCVGAYLRQLHESLVQPIYFVLGNHDFYRGTFDEVRGSVRELVRTYTRLHWLSEEGVIALNDATALIGHEGWGDGRWGEYGSPQVFPYDFHWIKDLADLDKEPRLLKLHALGDEAAAYLRPLLLDALQRYARVYLVTHVPPFCEACLDDSLRICKANKLPYYTCKAVGDMLLDVMKEHPQRMLTVLCGHTHRQCDVQILDNLCVMARNAGYGSWYTPEVLELT